MTMDRKYCSLFMVVGDNVDDWGGNDVGEDIGVVVGVVPTGDCDGADGCCSSLLLVPVRKD